jgi:hypothetical protein
MNRRTLLKALASLPVAGALGGCRREPASDNKPAGTPEPSPDGGQAGILRVALHGPFGVVIEKSRQFRIQAFVPSDDRKMHELRLLNLPSDKDVKRENGKDRYDFELLEDGLEVNRRQPYVDHGFDDFTIRPGAWKAIPEEYFVYLKLPAPDVITFNPKAVEQVQFLGGNFGTMPIDHVLEYRVRDWSKVRLRSSQFNDLSPLGCSDLYDMYQKIPPPLTTRKEPVPGSELELVRCSDSSLRTFYLGVGLVPTDYGRPGFPEDHAVRFFNERLLPSFPNSPDAKSKLLKAVHVKPCQPSSQSYTMPQVVPAVQRYPLAKPYLLPVASIEDCRVGGVNGTT